MPLPAEDQDNTEAVIIPYDHTHTHIHIHSMHLSILIRFHGSFMLRNKGATNPFDWIQYVIICQQLYMGSLCVQTISQEFHRRPLCKMPVNGCMLLHNSVLIHNLCVHTFPIVSRAGRQFMGTWADGEHNCTLNFTG